MPFFCQPVYKTNQAILLLALSWRNYPSKCSLLRTKMKLRLNIDFMPISETTSSGHFQQDEALEQFIRMLSLLIRRRLTSWQIDDWCHILTSFFFYSSGVSRWRNWSVANLFPAAVIISAFYVSTRQSWFLSNHLTSLEKNSAKLMFALSIERFYIYRSIFSFMLL